MAANRRNRREAEDGRRLDSRGSRQLPNTDFLDSLSEDISWIELRVTQEARVFGFRAGQAFFLVFLDRTHDIMS